MSFTNAITYLCFHGYDTLCIPVSTGTAHNASGFMYEGETMYQHSCLLKVQGRTTVGSTERCEMACRYFTRHDLARSERAAVKSRTQLSHFQLAPKKNIAPLYFLVGTMFKWVHCHHGMARHRFADRGDGLLIWGIAENILNKQSRTSDSGWSSSLGVRRGANHPPP
jgi:hypothetical protein